MSPREQKTEFRRQLRLANDARERSQELANAEMENRRQTRSQSAKINTSRNIPSSPIERAPESQLTVQKAIPLAAMSSTPRDSRATRIRANLSIFPPPAGEKLHQRSQSPQPSRQQSHPAGNIDIEPPRSAPALIDHFPGTQKHRPASKAQLYDARQKLLGIAPTLPHQTWLQFMRERIGSIRFSPGNILQLLGVLLWTFWILLPYVLDLLQYYTSYQEHIRRFWYLPGILNVAGWLFPHHAMIVRSRFLLPRDPMLPPQAVAVEHIWRVWELALQYPHAAKESFRYMSAQLLPAAVPTLRFRRLHGLAVFGAVVGIMIAPWSQPAPNYFCRLPGVARICQLEFTIPPIPPPSFNLLPFGFQIRNPAEVHDGIDSRGQINPFKALYNLTIHVDLFYQSTRGGSQIEDRLRDSHTMLEKAHLEIRELDIPLKEDINFVIIDMLKLTIGHLVGDLQAFNFEAASVARSLMHFLAVTIEQIQEVDQMVLEDHPKKNARAKQKIQRGLIGQFINVAKLLNKDIADIIPHGMLLEKGLMSLKKKWLKLASLLSQSRQGLMKEKRKKSKYLNYIGYYSDEVENLEEGLEVLDVTTDFWAPIDAYMEEVQRALRTIVSVLIEIQIVLKDWDSQNWQYNSLAMSKSLRDLDDALKAFQKTCDDAQRVKDQSSKWYRQWYRREADAGPDRVVVLMEGGERRDQK